MTEIIVVIILFFILLLIGGFIYMDKYNDLHQNDNKPPEFIMPAPRPTAAPDITELYDLDEVDTYTGEGDSHFIDSLGITNHFDDDVQLNYDTGDIIHQDRSFKDIDFRLRELGAYRADTNMMLENNGVGELLAIQYASMPAHLTTEYAKFPDMTPVNDYSIPVPPPIYTGSVPDLTKFGWNDKSETWTNDATVFAQSMNAMSQYNPTGAANYRMMNAQDRLTDLDIVMNRENPGTAYDREINMQKSYGMDEDNVNVLSIRTRSPGDSLKFAAGGDIPRFGAHNMVSPE